MSAATGASSVSPLTLFTPSWAVPGTGLVEVVNITQSQFGTLPKTLVDQIVPFLPGLFGDYPRKGAGGDIGPSIFFVIVFALLGIANLYIFVRNWLRGQRTYSWLLMTFYAFCMMIGFALRLQWAQNVLQVRLGVATVVFTQLPMLALNSMTFLYGERIFAWRHPQTAHAKWFRGLILLLYVVVVGIIVMAIVAQSIPYLYFLTEKHLHMCQQVTQGAAVLNLLYGLTGVTMMQIAWTFKPGTIDHRVFRYPRSIAYDELPNMAQATWIEKTSLFYFPTKGSQIKAPKNSYRVIPTRQPPHGGIANLLNGTNPNSPGVGVASIVVLVTSFMLVFSLCFRCASVFITKDRGGFIPSTLQPTGPPISSFAFRNYVFYIWYGAFEALVNVIFLVTRCDLRFYIPPWSNTIVETAHIHPQNEGEDAFAGEKDEFAPGDADHTSHASNHSS